MPTASGYAEISIQISHSLMSRSAYVVFGTDPTATDPAVVAAAVITAMTGSGSFQGMFDSNVTLGAVRASLGTDGGEDLVGVVDANLPGLITATATPPSVALLYHKRTSRGGRRGRGRMYVPWALDTSNIDEAGTIIPGVRTALQNRGTTFLSNLNANAVPMVILHNPGKTAQGSPNVVTTLTLDTKIGTQRRRLGRA